MEVAKTRLVLNKFGSDVPLNDCTPAEAIFLHVLHGGNNGGKTFTEKMDNFEVVGQAMVETRKVSKPANGDPGDKDYIPAVMERVARTASQELIRLRRKYNQARDKDNKPIINRIWPDPMNPKMPETFKEINWPEIAQQTAGIEVAAPNYVTGAVATSTLPTK